MDTGRVRAAWHQVRALRVQSAAVHAAVIGDRNEIFLLEGRLSILLDHHRLSGRLLVRVCQEDLVFVDSSRSGRFGRALDLLAAANTAVLTMISNICKLSQG